MPKIHIDTDPGQDIDDLLALWFALKRPELGVVGISTVTWPSRDRARLVRRLLRYLGREIIPVAAGLNSPLDGSTRARDYAAAMNHAVFAEPADARDDVTDEDAAGLIVRSIQSSPGQVVLCCIGPLSNIGEALRRDPSIAPQIKAIYLMGGESHLNMRENNIAWDADASRVVFEAGVPIAMGTWSVTRQFMLSEDDLRDISSAGELGEALGRAIKVWQPAQSWKPRPVMYDVFPFIHLIDPTLYTMQPKRIAIETRGEFTRGMTIAIPGEANATVSTSMNVEAVRALYRSTVLDSES